MKSSIEIDGIAADVDVLFVPFCEHLGGEYFYFDLEVRRLLLDHLAMEYEQEQHSRIQRVALIEGRNQGMNLDFVALYPGYVCFYPFILVCL